MISSRDIQNSYINLYRNLRNYVWEFHTVELLAELEIAVYKSFPDIDEIRNIFNHLYQDVRDVMRNDEDLRDSVESFKSIISQKDTEFYFKLNQVKEVITK